jgi:Ca-activated chloride channel family protein
MTLAVTLGTPLALLGLLLIPLGALALWLRSKRPRQDVVRFPAASTLQALVASEPRWPRYVAPALLVVAVIALSISFAKPERTVTVADRQASVMLVTDASGSMAATDVEPSRLEAVRAAAKTFLDRVPDDLRVGAMSFAQSPLATTRPTTDRDAVRNLIDDTIANGGTGTGDALDVAINAVRPKGAKDKDKPAAIVLLSDGRTTSGKNPAIVAQRAKELRVPVYTVSLGTPEGTVPGNGAPFPVPPDPDTMKRVAQVSGGKFYNVTDSARLSDIYTRLGRQIGSHQERRELSVVFAAIALMALLGALALSVRRAPALP